MKRVRVFIGHRGVGKTSLLRRIEPSGISGLFFDLDEEISRVLNMTIDNLFQNFGEAYFREKELEIFSLILKQKEGPLWVSVGGGFEIEKLSEATLNESEFIWLCRASDERGRVFLNRPALDPELKPLDDFFSRKFERDRRFEKYFDRRIWIPEGFGMEGLPRDFVSSNIEKQLIEEKAQFGSFGWTLERDILENSRRREKFLNHLVQEQVQFIELRDDILSPTHIEEALGLIPPEQVLFSFRSPKCFDSSLELLKKYKQKIFGIDIDSFVSKSLQVFDELQSVNRILSSHSAIQPWEGISEYEINTRQLSFKWSPLVENFSDLQLCLSQLKSRNVCFFPRSLQGKWRWFRLLYSNRNKINFFQRETPSALDQPLAFEVLAFQAAFSSRQEGKVPCFGAVLGDPVDHSFSPVFHFSFFKERKMIFFRICFALGEAETAFSFLESLGLRAAAVTAPLKKRFFSEVVYLDPGAQELGSVNTLVWDQGQWRGFNTDGIGFGNLIQKLQVSPDEKFLLWGGGGTRSMVEQVLGKSVHCVSARNPHLDFLKDDKGSWTLIWASSRSKETKIPPDNLRIQQVVDLNYTEDSLGREIARLRGIQYFSGIEMFVAQARAQQEIWSKYL
jgi:shikimate 5-dehydrogenase/shikimate kinase